MSTDTQAIVKANGGDKPAVMDQKDAVAPKVIGLGVDLYRGVAEKPFKKEAIDTLLAPIGDEDVEIRPDGLVYLPEIKYRRKLNYAFGPGAWAMVPRSDYALQDNTMTREYALFVLGRFVSEARGEQDYFPNSRGMTYATAAEGVKSNAIMRCCKDLGIASELWDPGFIGRWKAEYAMTVKVRVRGELKTQWRRKDRMPYDGEVGAMNAERPKPVESQPPHGACPSDDTQHASPDNASDPGSDDARSADRPMDTISEKQAKRLFAIARGRGMTHDQIKYLTKAAGYDHSRDIKTADYEQICSAMESWTVQEHENIGVVLAGIKAEDAGT